MNYLITASSILCTLLSLIALYFITTTMLGYIEDYNDRQELKSKLHPEVTLKDIEDDESLLTVTFDSTLTQMVMNNDDSERQEPISIMLMDEYDED